jgi:WD40 repeat protein
LFRFSRVICDGWQYHTARVNVVAFSPDNEHVASGGLDGQIIIWSRSNPKNKIQIKGKQEARSFSFSSVSY